MSQTGIVNISSGSLPPDVPLFFSGNVGIGSAVANIFEINGSNNISTSVAGNILTIDVTGTTDHAILIGNASGSISSVGPLLAGELLIGTGLGSDPVPATLTAGSHISIANASGSITISTTGVVTSVSGTAGRITSTGGTTPIIDIDATYIGQASITTLGTITTGTWNGSVIPLAYGGTNANLTASNGGIFYSTAAAGAILAGTATASKVLMSGSTAAPTWSIPTFPNSAVGTGTIIRADGTNWVATTATYPNTIAANSVLYGSAINTISELVTTANRIFVTDTSGIPSWGTSVRTDFTFTSTGAAVIRTLTISNTDNTNPATSALQQLTVGGASAGDPLTTYTVTGVTSWSAGIDNSVAGDPYVISASTALGTSNALSVTTAGNITIGTIVAGTWNGSVIQLAYGGTNANLTASDGGIFYSTAAAGAILAGTATASKVLMSGATAAPTWSVPTFPNSAAGTGTIIRADGTNWVATTSTYPNTNAVSTLLYASASNVMSALATANNGLLVTGNTGIPSILAGPGTTGNVLQSNAAAAPSFSTATYPSIATGTGTLLRADGTNWVATTSTYPTTNAVSTLLYASSANVMAALATGNNGVLITSAGGVPSWLAGGTTGQVLTATTGAPATWGAAGGGNWVKISAATASASATIDFTGLTSAYAAYILIITHLAPATDNVELWFRTSTDGGASYDSGPNDYGWATMNNRYDLGGTFGGAADNADSEILLSTTVAGNAANETSSFVIWLYNPSAAKYCGIDYIATSTTLTPTTLNSKGSGRRVTAADVDAIRVLTSSGNITSGIFTLYGVTA